MSRSIRVMTAADLPEVVAIERRVFSHPWSLPLFQQEIERPTSVALVCEEEHRILGYLIADMFVDVWHLMNISVDEHFRRQHVASDLLEAYFDVTERRPHRGHTLEVRVSNEPAIELYRSYGFVTTGVRPRYYDDNGEDALIMWKDWEGESA
jgi:ribosomal-protein-alanine N-acetyltransferase